MQVSDDLLDSEELIQKYVYKLKLFPDFYESLVRHVFKNLACNEAGCRFRLTSNSMRLLKEFQMRYCVVSLKKKGMSFKFDFLRHLIGEKGLIRRRSH